MTSGRRTRHPQWFPAWSDRAWAWLTDASDGAGVLLLVCLGVAAMGFGYYPIDLADRNTAQDLVANGHWAVVPDPLVHVIYYSGRGGNYFDVDKVKVRLPEVNDTVLLDVVDGPDMSNANEGWQKPTESTGYAAPLDVRYRVEEDGTVTAMARAEIDYWTISNSDPEFGLALGFGGLALAALSLTVNSARLARRERRRELRRRWARRAAMRQRKPKEADPD